MLCVSQPQESPINLVSIVHSELAADDKCEFNDYSQKSETLKTPPSDSQTRTLSSCDNFELERQAAQKSAKDL